MVVRDEAAPAPVSVAAPLPVLDDAAAVAVPRERKAARPAPARIVVNRSVRLPEPPTSVSLATMAQAQTAARDLLHAARGRAHVHERAHPRARRASSRSSVETTGSPAEHSRLSTLELTLELVEDPDRLVDCKVMRALDLPPEPR